MFTVWLDDSSVNGICAIVDLPSCADRKSFEWLKTIHLIHLSHRTTLRCIIFICPIAIA